MTPSIHIILGTPDPHFAELKRRAASGKVTAWTINKKAAKGDLVVFYMIRPSSSFVAGGIVLTNASRQGNPNRTWFGHYISDVGLIELLPAAVPLNHARRAFPDWGWLQQPHKSTAVPPGLADRFLKLLRADRCAPEFVPRISNVDLSQIEKFTPLVAKLNLLHNCTCQICGVRLEQSNGEGYAEGHHLKPLGAPHDGPDRQQNVLILCPNYRAQCHFESIKIVRSRLRTARGHRVAPEYIEYHNRRVRQNRNGHGAHDRRNGR